MISAVIGFVNLLSVLLKLTNKTKINKDVTRGIRGIRIDVFRKFPTKKKLSNFNFILFFCVILLDKIL